MKVVTTFHPPSAVVSSLKCKLSADLDIEHLVVAKLDRLDVFSCRPDGLRHECGLEMWGRILSVKAIPVKVCSFIGFCSICLISLV
jgi:DNA damage-binding protein 1